MTGRRLDTMMWRTMWSGLFICLTGLAGCGFEPMLATRTDHTAVSDELSTIKVAYIENRSGQVLRNDLVDALNPRGEPARGEYMLIVQVNEPQQNLALQRNNSVSFVGYAANASWALRAADGTVAFSGASSSTSQYAVSNSQYATVASAQNTRDRVMLDIAQDIRNKLAQFFATRKAPQPSADLQGEYR